MHQNHQPVTDLACPMCNGAPLETVRTIPYFRGFLVVFQHGEKRSAGCTSCVRKRMLGEVLRAVGYGWFSPKALVCTVVVTPITLVRAMAVKRDDRAVTALLDELGVPTNQHGIRMTNALVSIAAAAVHADKEVHPAEVQAAVDFLSMACPDEPAQDVANKIVEWKGGLNVDESATMLSQHLDTSQREVVLNMLCSIAHSDGDIAKSERKIWKRVAARFGISGRPADELWERQSSACLEPVPA